jgi:hypothetical protein
MLPPVLEVIPVTPSRAPHGARPRRLFATAAFSAALLAAPR